jgi:hypothetical protein
MLGTRFTNDSLDNPLVVRAGIEPATHGFSDDEKRLL